MIDRLGPVTYRILHAGTSQEKIVHVDRLSPYNERCFETLPPLTYKPALLTEGITDWQTVVFDNESNDDDRLLIETVQLHRPVVAENDLRSDGNQDHGRGTMNNDDNVEIPAEYIG